MGDRARAAASGSVQAVDPSWELERGASAAGPVWRSRRARRTGALAWMLVLGAAACGDDSGGDGAGDAGMDAAASNGGSGGFSSRRPDAQVLTDDPVPPCDRLDPDACGAGQECEVVVRRAEGENTYGIYDGCIESRAQKRGEGEPCEPFGGFLVAYSAPGLEDEVYVDPCDTGLFCAPDPVIRNTDTCQRSCVSGLLGCDSPTEYCSGPDQLRQVCVPSDGCDPTDVDACGAGAGCYLRLSDEGDRVLTVCLATQPQVIADGELCALISDCNPGSSCFGPTRKPPARWVQEDLECRLTCIPAAGGDEDGGTLDTDSDGGAPSTTSSGCPSGQSCVPFAESGLDTTTIPLAIGQCE